MKIHNAKLIDVYNPELTPEFFLLFGAAIFFTVEDDAFYPCELVRRGWQHFLTKRNEAAWQNQLNIYEVTDDPDDDDELLTEFHDPEALRAYVDKPQSLEVALRALHDWLVQQGITPADTVLVYPTYTMAAPPFAQIVGEG